MQISRARREDKGGITVMKERIRQLEEELLAKGVKALDYSTKRTRDLSEPTAFSKPEDRNAA